MAKRQIITKLPPGQVQKETYWSCHVGWGMGSTFQELYSLTNIKHDNKNT